MAKCFRLGIIGFGNRLRTVIPGIYEAGDIEIYAIADPNRDSIDQKISLVKGSPKIVSDYHELLAMPEVDGVLVAVPNYLHSKVAVDVLKAKKPLYLEKPMAISKQQCDDILACAKATGTPMMVGMQNRYNPVYQKMKELCVSGEIGDVKMLFYRAARGRFLSGVDGWRMKKAFSGGMILEVSVHQLDLFNWYADSPIKKVAAFGGKDAIYQNEELCDNAVLMVEYANGIKANLQASLFSAHGTDPTGLCIIGTKGTMYHTGNEITIKHNEKDANGEFTKTITVEGKDQKESLIQTAFRLLAQEGKQPLTPVEAGRDAVILSMLCEQSIETGKVIEA
ncbi:MAG: Gfo/Idh/MocA family oxidoreductase [Treponema sp.]|nr:Gfo/Idh/MocA family oxidoreductase [Treponema sp.]